MIPIPLSVPCGWSWREPTGHVHFVGFRNDRYHAAVRVWGVPDFFHLGWDRRALREIGEGDTVVFANGPHDQEPRERSFPDIIDGSEIGWSWREREVER